ncbi:hypothetical protein ACFFLM_23930 [Deinococcus oregonensis]|uniref:Uncharacterized protein n=1 Tax=Deinococcus oregonensis TaxID=1805970 RepID=A0ABV6B9C9_9DEIO
MTLTGSAPRSWVLGSWVFFPTASVLLVEAGAGTNRLWFACLVVLVLNALATWMFKRSVERVLMNIGTLIALGLLFPAIFWVPLITLGLIERIDGQSGIAGWEFAVLIPALVLLAVPLILWLRWYLRTFPPVTLAILVLSMLPSFSVR